MEMIIYKDVNYNLTMSIITGSEIKMTQHSCQRVWKAICNQNRNDKLVIDKVPLYNLVEKAKLSQLNIQPVL